MADKPKLDYIARKIAHWTRFGTPSQINPKTGAACPKWKLEADEEREKKRSRS